MDHNLVRRIFASEISLVFEYVNKSMASDAFIGINAGNT
jgi:hypothetical protein